MLAEILKGFGSDLPGHTHYHIKLTSRGEAAYDEDRLPLIESDRGTPRTEAWHRIMYAQMRHFQNCGVRLADVTLTEKKHRCPPLAPRRACLSEFLHAHPTHPSPLYLSPPTQNPSAPFPQ